MSMAVEWLELGDAIIKTVKLYYRNLNKIFVFSVSMKVVVLSEKLMPSCPMFVRISYCYSTTSAFFTWYSSWIRSKINSICGFVEELNEIIDDHEYNSLNCTNNFAVIYGKCIYECVMLWGPLTICHLCYSGVKWDIV